MLGMNAYKYPNLVRKVLDEGHMIGVHSYKHSDYATFTNPADTVTDLNQAAWEVYQASGTLQF